MQFTDAYLNNSNFLEADIVCVFVCGFEVIHGNAQVLLQESHVAVLGEPYMMSRMELSWASCKANTLYIVLFLS